MIKMNLKIKEPTNTSEFEIHALVYMELRRLGINARGEVKVPFHDTTNRRAVCRFDIAIFEDGFLVGIIEIKAGVTKHKKPGGWMETRQGSRYSTFGVPVAIIYGKDQAQQFIDATTVAGAICWNIK
jgi:hypothetical protein